MTPVSDQETWHQLHYPGTSVFRNRHGITDADTWRIFEQESVAHHSASIPAEGLVASDAITELCAYHRILFQNCYDWAGRIRDLDITKENPLKGEPTLFAAAETIRLRLAELDHYVRSLEDLPYDDKIDVLSYLHSELNEIHPFYEGNGRTTRIYMEKLAARHDVTLTWDGSHEAQILAALASTAGDVLDYKPWKALYLEIATESTWDDDNATPPVNYLPYDLEHGQTLLRSIGLSPYTCGDLSDNDAGVTENSPPPQHEEAVDTPEL